MITSHEIGTLVRCEGRKSVVLRQAFRNSITVCSTFATYLRSTDNLFQETISVPLPVYHISLPVFKIRRASLRVIWYLTAFLSGIILLK